MWKYDRSYKNPLFDQISDLRKVVLLKANAEEVIEFLIFERELGEPLLPLDANVGCCCTIF